MMRNQLFVAFVSLTALFFAAPIAEAGDRQKSSGVSSSGGAHPTSRHYRSGARVKGYRARRGGYSYSYQDSINTYGDSRSNFGSASSLRDPMLDRQSPAGPFDHGFFFDSGTKLHGGDSPYMN